MRKRLRLIKEFIINLDRNLKRIFYVINNFKILKNYKNFIEAYVLILLILQMLIIIILGYFYLESKFLLDRLIYTGILIFVLFFIKFSYIYILKINNWDGKFPIKKNEKLRKFFMGHIWLNKIGVIILKYFNIFRIFLILRNKFSIIFRYIRSFFNNINILDKWVIIERCLTFIWIRFIWGFLAELMVGYIKFKEDLLKTNIELIIYGRLKILIVIYIFKGALSMLVIGIIVKLITFFYKMIVDWAGDKEFKIKGKTNYRLLDASFIFKNLNYEKKYRYFGYNKVLVSDGDYHMSDSMYSKDHELQYIDIAKGLRMNELDELNQIIIFIFEHRLFVEYMLKNPKYKEYRKDLLTLQKKLVCIFEVFKKILTVLRVSNVGFELNVIFDDYNPIPNIEIKNKYRVNIKKIKKEIVLEKLIIKLNDLICEYLKREYLKRELNYGHIHAEFLDEIYFEYDSSSELYIKNIHSKYIRDIFLKELIEKL